MKKLMGKVDGFQQRHRGTAFAYGVVKKYGEDRGGYLAALITYYGFLSLFPLMLLFFTVTSYVLPHYPKAKQHLTNSVVGEFPVIGPTLQKSTDKPLEGSPVALVFGTVTLAWGALGVSQVLQQTMHDVWGEPPHRRPKFVSRVGRGLLLFVLLGLGIVATTVVTSLGSVLDWGPFGSVLAAMPAAIANVAVFLAMFRMLSPRDVSSRELVPGAVLAGVAWQVLQTVGLNLLIHQLRHASETYGVFGATLGLLSFLYLAARLTVYAAETNVVRARHLWPRSLLAETSATTDPTDWSEHTGKGRANSGVAVP